MKRSIQLIISLAAFVALLVATTSTASARAATGAQGQSGYWAQVIARDATLRDRPGGRMLKTLTSGQWFHVYPSYKNAAWYVGYACPNGNRGCSNRQSIPGYILKSTLSGSVAIISPRLPNIMNEAFSLPVKAEMSHVSFMGVAAAPAFGSQERRICAREVWMRNDKLRPIELLHAGDRFTVERYTDGSQNDGKVRWALGRAKNLQGRVLVTALCP